MQMYEFISYPLIRTLLTPPGHWVTVCAIFFHCEVSRTFVIDSGPEPLKQQTVFPAYSLRRRQGHKQHNHETSNSSTIDRKHKVLNKTQKWVTQLSTISSCREHSQLV